MTSGTLYTLLSIALAVAAVIGAGWRLAAHVTRWADEVRANTQAARKLARKYGKLAGRVGRIEQRMDAVESVSGRDRRD